MKIRLWINYKYLYGSYLESKGKYAKALVQFKSIDENKKMYFSKNLNFLLLNKYKYANCLLILGYYSEAIKTLNKVLILKNLICYSKHNIKSKLKGNASFCFFAEGDKLHYGKIEEIQ